MNVLNGKYLFGMVKVSEKGQIVIPKEARDVFGITAGSSLMLVGDHEQGLALLTNQTLTQFFKNILDETTQGGDSDDSHSDNEPS